MRNALEYSFLFEMAHPNDLLGSFRSIFFDCGILVSMVILKRNYFVHDLQK